MIVQEQDRQITESGVKSQTQFKLHHQSQAHLMHILRNSLYPDKVLAVLREYASNAWDSHRQSGKGDVPIKITLPTMVNPTLTIRDFGSGMSAHDLKHIFPEYGASTKRKTNLAVGMLGIGCKSGFCYSDSFTVTSWFKGKKMMYVAVMDQSNEGSFKNLMTVPCPKSETGLEISIPVKPQDIDKFHNKAKLLFSFFQPQPEINCTLQKRTGEILPEGFFQLDGPESENWVAIMGCVPYKVSIHQIETELTELGLWQTVKNTKGGLLFAIGDVQVSANREELEYNDFTRKALVQKFADLVGSYLKMTLELLGEASVNNWTKRLKASYLSHNLGISLPGRYGVWAATSHKLAKTPTTYHVSDMGYHGLSQVDSVRISPLTRIILKDDTRSIKGFDLKGYDYVIVPSSGQKLEEVRAELDVILGLELMDGVPVCNLSEIFWEAKSKSDRTGDINPKHKVKSFRLNDHNHGCGDAKSQHWDIEERVPLDDDVFVILEAFCVRGHSEFYERVGRDRTTLIGLGLPFPEIYGYKSTWNKRVDEKDCTGTEYYNWRDKVRKAYRQDPKNAVIVQEALWNNVFPNKGWSEQYLRKAIPAMLLEAKKSLGQQHALTKFLERHMQARHYMEGLPDTLRNAWAWLIGGMPNEPLKELEGIIAGYPLLRIGEGVDALYKHNHEEWFKYIKLVDTVASLAQQAA